MKWELVKTKSTKSPSEVAHFKIMGVSKKKKVLPKQIFASTLIADGANVGKKKESNDREKEISEKIEIDSTTSFKSLTKLSNPYQKKKKLSDFEVVKPMKKFQTSF